ncbi:MAG: precorrin-2 C(20)-methyltransferase [Planctomycetota bacterium]|jgi:precorrin-2/cobalt-factor-2 C20-methyltransferase|nr:precorrin-2 C(20)-methyltransferase [Planctomycetota bacterium]
MAKSILYGIGVGPGDPELITVKAIETIRKCQVAAAPRTPGGGTLALDIVRQAVDLEGKKVLLLDFAMSPDADKRRASHRAAAESVRHELDAGNAVALLNLGDVSVFSSFRYIADILGPEGYDIRMIPGVPSFCAAAARMGASLTDMANPLYIIPDGDGKATMPPADDGVTVYMKSGKHLQELLARLRECGRLDDAVLVQNCGLPDETIDTAPTETAVEKRYFSLVVVRPRRNSWNKAGTK